MVLRAGSPTAALFDGLWTDICQRIPIGIYDPMVLHSPAGVAHGFERNDSLDNGVPTALCKAGVAIRSGTWETVDIAAPMTAGSVEGMLKYTHPIW